VSDYFSASLPGTGMKFLDSVIDEVPNLSIITHIELLCWSTHATTEQNVKNLIADNITLNINPDVIAQCVALRKNKKNKTPDSIIAPTALAFNYTLVTNNEKDFANINGPRIVNPHKL